MPLTWTQAWGNRPSNETPPTATKRVRQPLDDAPSPLAYRQLDLKSHQIRILHLLAGNREDPIRCVLRTELLDDKPEYEALSYTWGDPLDCRSIEVDGAQRSITVNLYHALRRLRYPQLERRLWVDALCINQDNDMEKSHQVNLMSKIYSFTKKAIFWLGDFSDGPITKANQIPRETATAAFALLDSMAANNHFGSANKGITALSCLLRLPWWYRAWTVQEAVLPQNATVVCGAVQLPFSQFFEALDKSLDHLQCCRSRVIDFSLFWNQLQGLYSVRQDIRRKTISVSDAFNIFRLRQASDPRDRVYAYLGLGSEIPATYSLPHEEVFKLVTRSLIEESGTVRSLLRTDETERSPALPTWVPDWSSNFNEREYSSEIIGLKQYYFYGAAGTTKAATRISSSDAVLDLRGLIVDRIAEVGSILDSPGKVKDMIYEWQHKSHGEYPHGGTFGEASWRTAMGDMYKDQNSLRRFTTNDDTEKIAKDNRGQLTREVSAFTRNKRGFSTKSGMIGLGNRHIRVGDCICVLAGGKMPFILRQVKGDGDGVAYQYIGQSYVHGIMDGETMEQGRDLDWISLV